MTARTELLTARTELAARRRSIQNFDYGLKLQGQLPASYVVVDNPVFNPTNGLSVEAWFRTPLSPTTTMSIYSEGNSGTVTQFWILHWAPITQNLMLEKRDDAGAYRQYNFSGYNFLPDHDYHIVCVDDNSGDVSIYVNGALAETKTLTGVGASTFDRSGINVYRKIASIWQGNHTFYRVRTYNGTPLTATQVADLYYDDVVPATVVDSFLFLEGSGATTTSEQSTVGTIPGVSSWVTTTPMKARTDVSVARNEL